MQPLPDDDLILYLYGESPNAEAIRLRAEHDDHLRARIDALRDVLERVNQLPVPEPPVDFEGRLWRAMAPDLAPYRPSVWRRLVGAVRGTLPGSGSTSRRPFRPVLALAAVLVLTVAAFLLGRTLQPSAPGGGVQVASDRILLTAVGEHLTRSHRLVLELANADRPQGDWGRNRDDAGTLLADNRFFRLAATQAGKSQLIEVMESLERVLTELTNLPDDADTQQLTAVRRRIADQDLLFKVQVLNQIIERQTDPSTPNDNAPSGAQL